MKRALDRCDACGVTVVWAKIGVHGDLMPFERPDSPALAIIDTDDDALLAYNHWALDNAIDGYHPSVRDLTRGHPSPVLGERNALPHHIVCTRRLIPARKRRQPVSAYAR